MTERLTRMRPDGLRLLATFLRGNRAAFADKPITAVPPPTIASRGREGARRDAAAGAGAPARRIVLPAPSDAERASLKARNASTPAGAAPRPRA